MRRCAHSTRCSSLRSSARTCSTASPISSSCRTARSRTCRSRRCGARARRVGGISSRTTPSRRSHRRPRWPRCARGRRLRRRPARASSLPSPAELPASREEATVVAASYRGSTPMIGGGATEGALRAALGRSRHRPRRHPRRVRRAEPDVLRHPARAAGRCARRERRPAGDARGARARRAQPARLPLGLRDRARPRVVHELRAHARTTSRSRRRSCSPARRTSWRRCGGSRTGAPPSWRARSTVAPGDVAGRGARRGAASAHPERPIPAGHTTGRRTS